MSLTVIQDSSQIVLLVFANHALVTVMHVKMLILVILAM